MNYTKFDMKKKLKNKKKENKRTRKMEKVTAHLPKNILQNFFTGVSGEAKKP